MAAALRAELAPIRSMRLAGVACIVTGMGMRNAERAVRAAITKSTPRAILHCGFAGALSSELKVGDILVAERICGVQTVDVDASLLRSAASVHLDGVTLRSGTFLTFDRVIVTAGEKLRLAVEFSVAGPACLDMESAAVARVCAETRIPYLGIRCITDGLEEDLPFDLNRCRTRDGGLSLLRLGWQVAASGPRGLSGLLELRRRAVRGSHNLARVVDAVHRAAASGP